MGPTQSARCQTCKAIVNPAWETCAVCQHQLTSPYPQKGSLPSHSEDIEDIAHRGNRLGQPTEPSQEGRALGKVRPGDWAEWRSPALPHQRGEVLAVHPDETFEVFHPLTERLCRLPLSWVTRVVLPAEKHEGERTR